METASRLLNAKFEAARAFFEKACAAGVDRPTAIALETELNALEMRFALATSHLYILATTGENDRASATTEFSRILAAEGFASATDGLVARGEAAFRAAGAALRDDADSSRAAGRRGRGRGRAGAGARAPRGGAGRGGASGRAPAQVTADLQRLLDVYPRGDGPRDEGPGPADGAAPRVDYERCPACNAEMAVDAGRSELRCGECGAVRELVGTVFDDSQFYSQEGQKAKSGTFNPNRHFQFWWTHILAREPEEEIGDKDDPDNLYGEKLLASLRDIVARDRKILRLLTVNDVRAMLREVGHTAFNKNVPLLLKKLTGIGPPQVSDAIAARVENLFTKAIEIGERVRRAGRVNRNYYPFYIAAIADQIIPEDDRETRRMFYYIYVQSKETVESDDADWEQICLELPELMYKPTDRTMGEKYAPTG